MKPQNDPLSQRVGTSLNDQSRGSHLVASPRQSTAAQQAAADLVRGQISSIYSGNSGEDTPHTTPVAVAPLAPTQLVRQPEIPEQATEPNTISVKNHGFNTAPP
ncbi:hypothetical protein B7Z28_01860, partial [Candidatus Saccharibacteria bacterium 32-45-3]